MTPYGCVHVCTFFVPLISKCLKIFDVDLKSIYFSSSLSIQHIFYILESKLCEFLCGYLFGCGLTATSMFVDFTSIDFFFLLA